MNNAEKTLVYIQIKGNNKFEFVYLTINENNGIMYLEKKLYKQSYKQADAYIYWIIC